MIFYIRLPDCFAKLTGVLTGFIAVVVLVPTLRAADGDLDRTFGGSGRVTTHLSGGYDSASAAVRQPDGKLIVVGGPTVTRYNANGTLDTSFGSSGHARTSFELEAVALQPNGKIVATGRGDNGTTFGTSRFNVNGTPDATFGTGGSVTTHFTELGVSAHGVALQADGKIVCAGAVGQHFEVVRYLANGALDTTFGSGGKVATQVSSAPDEARAVSIQPDGKLIVVGGGVPGAGGGAQIVRYNTNGTLDSTFANGGKGTYELLSARAVALQSDGKIIGTGSIVLQMSGGGTFIGFGVVRVNPDGLLDSNFGNGGIASTAFGALEAEPLGVVVQPDGRILVAGDTSNGATDRAAIALARYNSNGTLDASFGTGGKVTTSLDELPTARDVAYTYATTSPARALILQPDGRFLTIGDAPFTGTGLDVVLSRYDAVGKLDATFGDKGVVRSNFGPGFDGARAVVVQTDRKVIVASGGIGFEESAQFDLVRYNADGTRDTGFGTNGHAVAVFRDHSGPLPAGATSMALQADGKIVVAGELLTLQDGREGGNFGIARFNKNGTLDTTFGTGGLRTVIFNTGGGYFLLSESDAGPAHIVIQPDGKIVLVGATLTSGDSDAAFTVARFRSDGTPDTSFGSKGSVVTSFSDSPDDMPTAVALQPDGKIVVAGTREQAVDIARYTSDGKLDPTFGTGGKVTTANDAGAVEMALTPAGKIMVLLDAADDIVLERFNSDGTVDSTFGTKGHLTTDLGHSETGSALAVQRDGRFFVAGDSYVSAANTSGFLVARYTPDGKLDPGFGAGGFVTSNFQGYNFAGASAMAFESDGKIVAAGGAGSDIALARYVSSPPLAARLANISTRLSVETGENVLIGGFIVTGTQPKKVLIRGLGPSLPVGGALADPILELYSGKTLLETNGNWMDSPEKQAIIATTIPPKNNLESAIVRTLAANNGAYTAIVRGAGIGTGVGQVEVYDLDQKADSELANISTRGLVQTGENVMIGGFIVLNGNQKVIVRAIGPSLPVSGALQDPVLELHNSNGAVLQSNDNWKTGGQQAEIIATAVPPTDDRESAIVRTLAPGNYTGVVRGLNNTTGVALVEVFALN
jgi:uncharacterized delta-60 repeat protein